MSYDTWKVATELHGCTDDWLTLADDQEGA